MDHDLEPDLDAEGKPLMGKIEAAPGVWRDYPLAQTKRDNYIDFCVTMGGEDKVTREAVEAAGLDWREWGYFVVSMLEHQRDTQEHVISEVARLEAATGKKIELPKLIKNRLGLLRLKDQPEGASGPRDEDESPAGREPPPGTHWG